MSYSIISFSSKYLTCTAPLANFSLASDRCTILHRCQPEETTRPLFVTSSSAVFTRQTEPVASSTMLLPLFVFFLYCLVPFARSLPFGRHRHPTKKIATAFCHQPSSRFFFFRPSGCAVSKRLRNRCLRSIFTLKIIQVP